jgi:hypothetical protein
MPEGDPIRGRRRVDKRGSASHRPDVSVAGLLRDSNRRDHVFPWVRCRGRQAGVAAMVAPRKAPVT